MSSWNHTYVRELQLLIMFWTILPCPLLKQDSASLINQYHILIESGNMWGGSRLLTNCSGSLREQHLLWMLSTKRLRGDFIGFDFHSAAGKVELHLELHLATLWLHLAQFRFIKQSYENTVLPSASWQTLQAALKSRYAHAAVMAQQPMHNWR